MSDDLDQGDSDGFNERFVSLEAASRVLSADVTALNQTLLVVAELQRKQREQAARQAQTEQALAAAKQIGDEREARRRTATKLITVSLGILLPLVSVLVYLSLLLHVNDLLSQQNADRFTGCQVRNQATIENRDREAELGRLENNPELKALHLNSAAQLGRSLVDCSKFQVTK